MLYLQLYWGCRRQVFMSFWESLQQILSKKSEESQNTTPKLPEMSETPFRRGIVEALLMEDGRENDVAKAWESILNAGASTSNTAKVNVSQQHSPNLESTWDPKAQEAQNTEEMLSQYAEEGSEEYAAKALSPLPEMDDNSCWHSLEFGHNTFGKIGRMATLERSWYAINWLDKRTIVLRSTILSMQKKLNEVEVSQQVIKAEAEDIPNLRERLVALEAEHSAWCLETKALRRLISNVAEENTKLSQENQGLSEDLGKLKSELNKTNRVLLKVIDYIGRDDISGISQRANQEVPKSVNGDLQSIKDEPRFDKSKAVNARNFVKEDEAPSHSISSDDESDQDDPTKFLEQRLMDPVKRRMRWAKRKKKPVPPNNTVLNDLPKYGGPTARMNNEELQRVTLSWLNRVEGLVLTGEVKIQDIYDRLPYLLEENAQIWFRQTITTSGHFKTWDDFRKSLLTVFLGPDWKYSLERSFAVIKQEDKEPGVNYVLRVWSLARKIDPLYPESAILAKIATTMKTSLWEKIPRDERNDYNTLVKVVAAYDDHGAQASHHIKDQSPSKKPFKAVTETKKKFPVNMARKRECFLCQKEGHIARECPNRKLIASTIAQLESQEEKKGLGKGRGALLGTK